MWLQGQTVAKFVPLDFDRLEDSDVFEDASAGGLPPQDSFKGLQDSLNRIFQGCDIWTLI